MPLDIRVRNEGAAVEHAPAVTGRATSPAGETFTALWGGQTETGDPEFGLTNEDAEETLIVKRKSTVDLSGPAVPFTDNSWAQKIDIIDRAITLHPDSPVVPRPRYAIAQYYGMEADSVFVAEGDIDKAVSLAEKGRAELARLKNNKDAWSKLIANQREEDSPSCAGFVELQRLQSEKGLPRK